MTAERTEILLVEDDPGHAELMVRTIRRHHISNHIRVARDGAEALAILVTGSGEGRWRPKFILLDLKLPKIDGIDVLCRIKSDPRIRLIPVVMLSSSHEDRELRKCYELGAVSHLVKSADLQQFTEVVQELGLYEGVRTEPLEYAARQ